MSQMYLQGIVEAAEPDYKAIIQRGETLEVEFKDDNREFSDKHVIEAVVAMANTHGGLIERREGYLKKIVISMTK